MTQQPNKALEALPAREWWRGATIYQIYPRSFADSNDDGIGDLNGIFSRLEYVARLGVDAIWLSPFFTSPMKDFGYDVADYCNVDPIFGTLDDFDRLISAAHAKGLKILIDQVYSHTSDHHSWFTESRSSKNGAKSDWYVWADAKADGSPPNNWQAVFGGPSWTWDARRGQYYMHNFLSSQPQLNCHNPDVQEALLNAAKFWLDRGVDGFRVDAINFAMHNPALTDNPPAPPSNHVKTRPFDFQQHIHNQSHPDIADFIKRIRQLTDSYVDRFTFAEVGGPNPEFEMKAFTQGDAHFNSAYGFNFLYAEQLTPALVRDAVESWPDGKGIGWPTWAFSNHDAPRWISRWAPPEFQAPFARMTMLLFVCLRGNIILWQGEELGMTQVDVPFDQLQDPEAIANWPLTLSRDGTRTPIPWSQSKAHCGFSNVLPWLPFGHDHPALAVECQEREPDSMLALTRSLIDFRNSNQALRTGSMKIIEAQNDVLVFERVSNEQHLLCIFNFSREQKIWSPPQQDRWRILKTVEESTFGAIAPLSGLVAVKLA